MKCIFCNNDLIIGQNNHNYCYSCNVSYDNISVIFNFDNELDLVAVFDDKIIYRAGYYFRDKKIVIGVIKNQEFSYIITHNNIDSINTKIVKDLVKRIVNLELFV